MLLAGRSISFYAPAKKGKIDKKAGLEMTVKLQDIVEIVKEDLITFAQQLIRIESHTLNEEEIIRFVKVKMIEMGYDDVFIDDFGNVVGLIGNGDTKVLYDCHVDTVSAGDADLWTEDPYGGVLKEGKLFGRGAVDMKSALAATVYAGYAIKRWGLAKDKTIYVVASIMEEDFDGEALNWMLKEKVVDPDCVVICEPSSLDLAVGHRGRAMIKITTQGISAHGSAPQKGLNAIYKMPTIINRIDQLQKSFEEDKSCGGSVAITRIESDSVSLNAIPSQCSIYLDRRLAIGEDEAFIAKEMSQLLESIDAEWSIFNEYGNSWTGKEVVLRSFLPAWEMEEDSKLVLSALNALDKVSQNPNIIKWDFCTNGVASAGIHNIPTIGYGPGNPKMAHKVDEYCQVDEIIKAFEFYTTLAGII